MTAPHSRDIPLERRLASQADVLPLAMRGSNMVSNGWAETGTNVAGFERFDVLPGGPPGIGYMFAPKNQSAMSAPIEQYIPVDPFARYEASYWTRNIGTPGSVDNSYLRFNWYDRERRSINRINTAYRADTRTTLAEPLKSGDTEMVITDKAAEWAKYVNDVSYWRYIGFWNYKDGLGYEWAPYTYTRHTLGASAFTAVDVQANRVTLNAAYRGQFGTIPAGTDVSVNVGGDSEVWNAHNGRVEAEWVNHTATLGGNGFVEIGSGSGAGRSRAPWGGAYVRPSVLFNRGAGNGNAGGRRTVFAGITLSEARATARALAEAAAGAGPSSNRPGPEQRATGTMYYDWSINRPIWWDGSKWINASGGTV